MKIPETPPYYFTTNQSEESHAFHSWLPQTCPLKTLPWKQSGSSSLLSTSCPISLLGACNKCCTILHHSPVSVGGLCCTWARGLKFGLVTVWSSDQQHQYPIGLLEMQNLSPTLSLLKHNFCFNKIPEGSKEPSGLTSTDLDKLMQINSSIFS